ncbi:MAG: sigma-70 family RNA polymerase sigma factor [Pseudomonadota bacterium]
MADSCRDQTRANRANQSTKQAPEDSLVAGLIAHHPASFASLHRAYRPRLLSVLASFLKNPEDVADVYQETILQVYRGIDRYEGRSSLWYWVRGIAVKQAMLRLRQQQRRGEVGLDYVDASRALGGVEYLRVENGPSALAERACLTARLEQAMERLTPEHRSVVLLRDVLGFTSKETAQMLGIQATAARVRLHRARLALRLSLDGMLDGTEQQAR